MATRKLAVQTLTALTTTGLSTLASATYVASNTYTPDTNQNVDVIIEAALATTSTPTGNKQALIFISPSLDGTNFASGPTSGTTTTDEPDHRLLGVIAMNTATTTHRGQFSVFKALGYVPKAFKIIVKNDLGVALPSGTLSTSEISETIV